MREWMYVLREDGITPVFLFWENKNIEYGSNRFNHYGDWQGDHICIVKNMSTGRLIEEVRITEKLYVISF